MITERRESLEIDLLQRESCLLLVLIDYAGHRGSVYV